MGNNNQTDDFQQAIKELLSCPKTTELEYGSVSNDNIFQILNIENKELFHSRFLKYLIDNNWDSFIKLFKLNENKNAGKLCSSQCEFFCPAMSDCPKSKNGRIDLYFEAEKYIVAIEVKWRAGEQPTQLLRYHRYLQKSNKQFTLIFLTPTGRSANKTTCSECEKKCSLDNTEYYNLSFAELTKWLGDLEKSNKNGLISQYCEILTKETKNIMNAEKILEMINKADTFKAACALADGMDTVKEQIRTAFFEALTSKLSSLGYDMSKIKPKIYKINHGNNNEEVGRVAYYTNLYCQKGDKWWYIKPEWFKDELNLDPNQQSDKENANENCKINLTKLSGADNPVVKWYFEEDTEKEKMIDNKEKMIDNVAKNILRQLGLNNTH
ncbi:MAG TPA: PD-(D/E)XK nuclease family protein [Candidatus Faecicola pullistercoris]|nr:PD-(D/E)XK nuclease family protein [Candidatus Faecicola pullistercoris]